MTALQLVNQITGPGSINATDTRWNLYGSDLGSSFWYQGSLYMVFGDSYGPQRHDWRSNVLARVASTDPVSGFRFASMITDASGSASELLTSQKVDKVEHTVIPTYGVAVGNRMILHYMSVNQWGPTPGRWQLNDSGLAYSDDGGQTWTKDPQAEWPGNSNFGQVAMVPLDGMIYMFGLPAGRFGAAQLARVPQAEVLDLAAYRYWDGTTWQANPSAAASVVPAPVGELSVRWSAALHQWLMMYLDQPRASIVLRLAPQITGPWSAEIPVASATTYPRLYAPYMLPVETGDDVYFTLSLNGAYEVYLMKMTLRPSA